MLLNDKVIKLLLLLKIETKIVQVVQIKAIIKQINAIIKPIETKKTTTIKTILIEIFTPIRTNNHNGYF